MKTYRENGKIVIWERRMTPCWLWREPPPVPHHPCKNATTGAHWWQLTQCSVSTFFSHTHTLLAASLPFLFPSESTHTSQEDVMKWSPRYDPPTMIIISSEPSRTPSSQLCMSLFFPEFHFHSTVTMALVYTLVYTIIQQTIYVSFQLKDSRLQPAALGERIKYLSSAFSNYFWVKPVVQGCATVATVMTLLS